VEIRYIIAGAIASQPGAVRETVEFAAESRLFGSFTGINLT
jgi:hypothetical protein